MLEALCPTCGAKLPGDAPEGLCPRCLFRRGLAEDGDLPGESNGQPTSSHPGSWTPPAIRDLAPHFPHLEIIELLGQGGMGAVYKARQVKLDRLVALKVLPPHAGREQSFTERFAREARALARLSHPHIVGVHDFGEAGGLFYFVMEYVDGFNLRQWLQAGRLQRPGALDILPQVCDALQFAHDEGVIHRDVKPENILLTRKGQVKIADFGLAKLLGPGSADYKLTGTHQVMGTPRYMAPEQFDRPHTVDHRADIYAVGVLFYEMLTGELPLGRFAPPSDRAPVDPRIDAVVLRALENEPDRRYKQVRELKQALAVLDRAPAAAVADAIAAAPSPRNVQEELEMEQLRDHVRLPAIGLTMTAILGAAFWIIYGICALCMGPRSDRALFFLLELLAIPILFVAVMILLIGARRIFRFERIEFVMFAALWAMIPWSGLAWPVGLIAGAWTLLVLCRAPVRLAFARQAVRRRLGIAPLLVPSNPKPPPPPRRPEQSHGMMKSAFLAMWSLVVDSREKLPGHRPDEPGPRG